MSRRLIAASSVLSLAACVASPVHQSATTDQDGAAVTPSVSVPPPDPSLTTLAWGEEEDGGGTVVSTMAIGEEEDGGGTMIEDEPIIMPDPHSFLGEPSSSVADIMARLRLSQG
ncbi:hypothetical protein MCELHM10_01127 [Paracoccaceae bacterium]